MTREVVEQLAQRAKEHIWLKERKPTDFVKGRQSEQKLFASQADSYERGLKFLQNENQEILAAGDKGQEGFDKEAYLQLKTEIKRRREAKEKLLQQGFPELKPYVHI